MSTFLPNVLIYLFLCTATVCLGYGILAAFQMHKRKMSLLFLSPITALAFWTVALNVGVLLGTPMKQLWVVMWGVSLPFIVVGARLLWRTRIDSRLLFLLCLTLPLLITGMGAWYGSAASYGDILPDGWTYIAYGQYLWDYSRGVEGALNPLYQFSRLFNSVRFTASALLSFFSSFFAGDGVYAASGVFVAWALFVTGTAYAYFGQSEELQYPLQLLFILIALLSGWIFNLLWANNYDNLLALGYSPILVSIVKSKELSNIQWGCFLGGLSAAVLYTYPELSVIVIGNAFIAVCWLFWKNKELGRQRLVSILWIPLLSIVLLSPFLSQLYEFVVMQLSAAVRPDNRPGEVLFQGLLRGHCQPSAFWGLGCEQSLQAPWLYVGREFVTSQGLTIHNLIGCGLFLLLALGLWRLMKKRAIDLLSITLLVLIGVGFIGVVRHYSYGMYKCIVLGWWALSFTVILGLEELQNGRDTSLVKRWARGVAYGIIFMTEFIVLIRIAYVTYTKRALPISDYQQVSQVADLMRGDGAIVAVDNWLANGWAVYFLRKAPLYLAKYRMYMASPNSIASLEKAHTVSLSDIRYLLTDSKDCFCLKDDMDLVWIGGPYHLWKFLKKDWAAVTDIKNPNGIAQWKMAQGFWIGTSDTELDIVASKAGWAMLRASFSPDPNIPEGLDRKILVLGEQGKREVITISNADSYSFSIPVVAGKNRLKLHALDPPLTQLPNHNSPPLLLEVQDLQVSLRDEPS